MAVDIVQFVMIFLVFYICLMNSGDIENIKGILTRKRRHLKDD